MGGGDALVCKTLLHHVAGKPLRGRRALRLPQLPDSAATREGPKDARAMQGRH